MADQPAPNRPIDFVDVALVIGGIAVVVGILFILAFQTVPKDNMIVFTAFVSFVTGAWVGPIIGNRFGSSKGSEDKTAALVDLANKQ
jgi:hypothetical protein